MSKKDCTVLHVLYIYGPYQVLKIKVSSLSIMSYISWEQLLIVTFSVIYKEQTRMPALETSLYQLRTHLLA